MSSLAAFLESKKLKSEAVYWASTRIEARSEEDHKLATARAAKKEKKDPAAEAIAKPKSGRGFSRKQLETALAGKAITRRARAKVLRSINALLEKAKQPAATMKDVFGEEKPQVGKSKVAVKKVG
jgi:hypothetical protein